MSALGRIPGRVLGTGVAMIGALGRIPGRVLVTGVRMIGRRTVGVMKSGENLEVLEVPGSPTWSQTRPQMLLTSVCLWRKAN